ncbi:hypothetical protein N7540_006502 [Penicillium herquei]|nr:hypothetical protein N7540_006502 [Penicillium herquei]
MDHRYHAEVLCPLCGISLGSGIPSHDLDRELLSLSRYFFWFEQVRGLYRSDLTSSVCVTGVGLVLSSDIPNDVLYAPTERTSSYRGKAVSELENWKICNTVSGPWCIGLHDSCWQLLLLRIRQSDAIHDEMEIAESLFKQLSSMTYIPVTGFQFGHFYGGGSNQRMQPHYFAGPDDIPSFEELERAAPMTVKSFKKFSQIWSTDSSTEASLINSPQGRTGQHRTGSGGSLSYLPNGLPPELIFEILSYLPFTEVLKLRLVCRQLAVIFEFLPESYWRSRFCIGQEADFLFPNLKESRKWESTFLGTSRFLRDDNHSMLNRRRIRDVLEPIAVLYDLNSLFKAGPHGYVVSSSGSNNESSFQLQDCGNPNNESLSLSVVASRSGYMQGDMKDPLKSGCQEIYHRAQSLATPPAVSKILVSTIHLGTRRFISGFSIFPGVEYNITSHGLGYHVPHSQQQISHNSKLKSIRVAFRPEGLVGIKFKFEDSHSTPWIGDIGCTEIVLGKFSLPQDSSNLYLIAALDHYKIVSLDLAVSTIDPGTSINLKA